MGLCKLVRVATTDMIILDSCSSHTDHRTEFDSLDCCSLGYTVSSGKLVTEFEVNRLQFDWYCFLVPHLILRRMPLVSAEPSSS